MAAMLQETLLTPDTKPKLVADCQALIVQQVSEMSGVSGTAIKLAYKTANAFASGYIRHIVETLLPDLAEKLEPYWADFNAAGGAEFGDYLAKRGPEVSEALLEVTDARAGASSRPTIVKAYRSVRSRAGKHVEAALPQVGALVQKYAA
ncbi:MAG: DUF6918 family protein [Streptosporangiaceae bacterium]